MGHEYTLTSRQRELVRFDNLTRHMSKEAASEIKDDFFEDGLEKPSMGAEDLRIDIARRYVMETETFCFSTLMALLVLHPNSINSTDIAGNPLFFSLLKPALGLQTSDLE